MNNSNLNENNKAKKLGIYVHIPYCMKKCRYCDFLSYTTHSIEARAYYTIKVCEEIVGRSKVYGNGVTVDSVFIGGGTPSLLETEYIEEILDVIFSRFHMDKNPEITIESNPGTLNITKLKDYRALGINRLSMGVQSLNEDVLKYLGRIHTGEDALKNYKDARNARFDNINLDMMFGIPGQTKEIWKNDFRTIIEHNPDHISFYSLQVEDGTQVFNDIMDGIVTETDPVIDREMYHDAMKMLNNSGYNHYEISNAAIPGHESIHNLKYWSMQDYLGVGLGSHSFVDGKRFSNTEILKDYLSNDGRRGMYIIEHESTKADHMAEYIFLGLRKTEGISLKDFEEKYGQNFLDLYRNETEDLLEKGLIEIIGDRLKLTTLGLDLSNQVFREYV